MTSEPALPIWKQQFRLRTSEIAPNGYVRPSALLNLFQEGATNHAINLGVGKGIIDGRPLMWVLSRMKVRFSKRMRHQETANLETWPAGTERLFALRDFEISDDRGDNIASGTSFWLVIDPEKRRPVRMPPAVTGIKLPERDRARVDFEFSGLWEWDTEKLDEHTVKRSDLDINYHVNNVRYIEWMLDVIPNAIWESHQLHTLDIAFRAEAFLNDVLDLSTRVIDHPDTGILVETLISRKTDGKTVTQILSTWSRSTTT